VYEKEQKEWLGGGRMDCSTGKGRNVKRVKIQKRK
jgi:hypothetical protein